MCAVFAYEKGRTLVARTIEGIKSWVLQSWNRCKGRKKRLLGRELAVGKLYGWTIEVVIIYAGELQRYHGDLASLVSTAL